MRRIDGGVTLVSDGIVDKRFLEPEKEVDRLWNQKDNHSGHRYN
jgi:hypothetical protein